MGADDLIGEARRRSGRLIDPPPPEAVAELRRVLEYNDSVPQNRRVSRTRALAMLKSEYGYEGCAQTFDRWLRDELDRGWTGR